MGLFQNFKGIDTSKYNQNKENEIRANLRKEQNQKKFDKATEVLGYVSQGFSTASQMAQAVSSMSKDEDKSVQQRKVLNLSNMKKGKALIKKVKQRRQVSKHFNKYYA